MRRRADRPDPAVVTHAASHRPCLDPDRTGALIRCPRNSGGRVMQNTIRRSSAILAGLVAIAAAALPLAACSSGYDGPITNEAPRDDTQGPPLLTNGFAP